MTAASWDIDVVCRGRSKQLGGKPCKTHVTAAVLFTRCFGWRQDEQEAASTQRAVWVDAITCGHHHLYTAPYVYNRM